MIDYAVKEITSSEAIPWLKQVHYAKRVPMICRAFGLFDRTGYMIGVCTFGLPASNELTIGICGEEHKSLVIELNRLVLQPDLVKNTASFFVSRCLKKLPSPTIIVSFADTAMSHTGYVYQCTNWIYTGLSAKRYDWIKTGENKHSRPIHGKYSGAQLRKMEGYEKVSRSRKHRYIYFKGCDKKVISSLKYPVLPYPKGDNKNYFIDTSKIVGVGSLF